jgi:hypothetical protein
VRGGMGSSGIALQEPIRTCYPNVGSFTQSLEELHRHKSTTSSMQLDTAPLPNYGKHTFIETIEDLQLYEQHADLLRTILKACTEPRYEDLSGRNGLHCLAEVSLDLPIPGVAFRPETNANDGNHRTPRERYLEDLLRAGVDPDNHDKRGDRPLMAFIRYLRVGEDDAVTTRILSRLCDAGADINRRDREGEAPLHIAVKLGRRAATKFLLNHEANIHARDSDGMGILRLGEANSKRAKRDESSYAQIMLCMALVANVGAVSRPTLLQEWASPQWKVVDG